MKTETTLPAHTPGPWIVDDRHVHCKTGLTYPRGEHPETDVIVQIDTDCHERGLLTPTDLANLRLIAAAPEMLATLREVVGAGHDGLFRSDPHRLTEARALFEKARALLARVNA